MSALRFRAFALLAGGAMTVHQLRYAIAPGSGETGAEHGYLHAAIPGAVIVALLAAGHLLTRLRLAWRSGAGEPSAWGARRLWPAASTALAVAYLMQEWAEAGGLGSPGAVLAPLANGGWVALPLAVAAGFVLALLLRGAGAAIAWAARGARVRSVRARDLRPTRPPARLWAASPNPLASFLAGRAPPPLGA